MKKHYFYTLITASLCALALCVSCEKAESDTGSEETTDPEETTGAADPTEADSDITEMGTGEIWQ